MQKPLDIDLIHRNFRLNDNGMLERFCSQVRKKELKHPYWKEIKVKASNKKGYCKVNLKGSPVSYHRLVWILHHEQDVPDGLQIDHKNGDKLDNSIENLRALTCRDNTLNQKKHREGKLGGCSFNKQAKKWQAAIWIDGKTRNLGYFNTEADAHAKYMSVYSNL